jgi:hypothetical protein
MADDLAIRIAEVRGRIAKAQQELRALKSQQKDEKRRRAPEILRERRVALLARIDSWIVEIAHGVTQAEIARRENLSPSRVGHLIRKAGRLRKRLTTGSEHGIDRA